jgi:hypothetical protein
MDPGARNRSVSVSRDADVDTESTVSSPLVVKLPSRVNPVFVVLDKLKVTSRVGAASPAVADTVTVLALTDIDGVLSGEDPPPPQPATAAYIPSSVVIRNKLANPRDITNPQLLFYRT